MLPHDWLAAKAAKHGYSLRLMRLSIAAYRLGRALGIAGVFSDLVFGRVASRRGQAWRRPS